MFRRHLLTVFFVGLVCTAGFGQKAAPAPPLKSLLATLRSVPNDTNKVLLLADVGDRLISRLPDSKDSALSYFEQGLALGKKLQYDSGIVRNMLGVAKVWVGLSQLKRTAEVSDSAEYQQLKHHFNAAISYVKQQKRNQKTATFYCIVANLLPPVLPRYHDLLAALYDSASVYSHKAHNVALEATALFWVGFYYEQRYGDREGNKLFRKSISVAEAAGQKGPSQSYARLGNNLMHEGDYKGGLPLLLTAFNIVAKDSASYDPEKASDFGVLCIFLGLSYDRLKNEELALKYQLTAVRTLERIKKTHGSELLSATGNVTAHLLDLNRPQEALDFLLRIYRKHPSLKSVANHYVGFVSFMRIYTNLKNFQLAQKYCDTLLMIADKKPFLKRSYIYTHATNFLIRSKQYDRAKKYGLMLKEIQETEKQNDFLSKTYYLLYQVDSAQGNFKSALSYYIQHKQLNDSSLNETSIKEIERLNIEFDTKNKEQQLALVSKNAEITRQHLHEARIRTNITVAGLVIAVIVLVLIFYLYRIKKKTGDELQRQRDEINHKNLALERAMQEKEWLLKEVHHRMKNNLHMISNLLSMQAYDLQDDIARTAIKDSHNRVQAMSMVHQKLSSDSRVSLVHFPSYLADLIDQLKESYDTRRVHFQVSVAPIIVDAGKAISLGLIINEAVTNSIKYAFPRERTGTVLISLHNTTEDLWKLVIQDDGVGIPPDEPLPPKSIGMTLIEGISQELDGAATIDSTNGFLIEIIFPLESQTLEELNNS